jgi:hypothetical protein
MQQTATSLATTAGSMQATPSTADVPTPGVEAIADAHHAALQAAAGLSAMAAVQAGARLEQAANQAAREAAALGANPQPSDLNMASGGGGSKASTESTGADASGFTTRFDPRLRDWLRLHREREQEVLQAQGSEGPEEYRTIIKRYFHEVSRRGGEEGEP